MIEKDAILAIAKLDFQFTQYYKWITIEWYFNQRDDEPEIQGNFKKAFARNLVLGFKLIEEDGNWISSEFVLDATPGLYPKDE